MSELVIKLCFPVVLEQKWYGSCTAMTEDATSLQLTSHCVIHVVTVNIRSTSKQQRFPFTLSCVFFVFSCLETFVFHCNMILFILFICWQCLLHVSISVRLSVCHALVLYQNDSTYRQSLSTICYGYESIFRALLPLQKNSQNRLTLKISSQGNSQRGH